MSPLRLIFAREILDSRGRPTIACTISLDSGAMASASVPSGASTGSAEALELRDGEARRYRGLGCRKAVENVNDVIANSIVGKSFHDQATLDHLLIELDGTPNKARLGANAILAVSLAFARASAIERGVPLFAQFATIANASLKPDQISQPAERTADLTGGRLSDSKASGQVRPSSVDTALRLPRLTVNLFSGGKHAGGQMPVQDILLVPLSAKTIDDALADVFAVFYSAVDLTQKKYGVRPLRADEGGLAPPFASVEAALGDTVEAIQLAGLLPGEDVAIAIDVASSHFYERGQYVGMSERPLESPEMIDLLADWVERFPIVSVEDGLAEEDWDHWPALRSAIGGRALVLGDDFLCTNPTRIRKAAAEDCCSALLLKVNQIGTLTEAAEALSAARTAGWAVTVSARSGETEDNWLADLAVGFGGDQIKIGSITQSERLAKYNRLLEIEVQTGMPVIDWPQS